MDKERFCRVCGCELTDDEIDICEECESEYYSVDESHPY